MSIIASDNFNRANGSLGANWTTLNSSTWAILSNAATMVAGGADNYLLTYWNGNSFPNDQYASVQFSAIGANFSIGPAVRVVSPETFYWSFYYDGAIYLQSVVAGASSVIASASRNVNSGDVLYLAAQGTAFTVKVNGSTLFTASDSSISSGAAGMGGYYAASTGWAVTPWIGGNFPSTLRELLLLGVGK